MSLSEPILTVLREFESAFSQPTWHRAQVLLVGTLLARGRRTVSAALRHTGGEEVAATPAKKTGPVARLFNRVTASKPVQRLLDRKFRNPDRTP